ncbi:MAG: hypothetical protein IJE43_11165 [Alphaproteobacteria bacterium]|nr:hypothetical protein [Alphaproteobacteria bacterium]
MNKKIGIDFHGVISSQPEVFEVFTKEIRKHGVEVFVISGGPEKDIIKYMHRYHIEYDHVWGILDYYETQGQVAYFDDGSFQVPTELWNRAKAEYCAKEGIEFHIDDSNVYGKYFVTPYCKYDISGGVCELGDRLKVDFNKPIKAAQIIAEFLKKA